MNRKTESILEFAGHIFTLVAAILFYNTLYVAAGNPGFFVVVYFDYFGEGTLELILFTLFIPFIMYSYIITYRRALRIGREQVHRKEKNPK